MKRCPAACSASSCAKTAVLGGLRRSRACDRRPRRGPSRPRARACRRARAAPRAGLRRRRDRRRASLRRAPYRWAASAAYPCRVPAALDGLSPAQRAAASHAAGPLLLVGGAGSGKTRTLVARFAWLVEQGEAPEAILALRALRARGRRAAARRRARDRAALRGACRHDGPCVLRAAAARAGARGRQRPLRGRRRARRPARDAAGADRRADDPPPRLPRQPGGAADRLPAPHRPSQGRADRPGGLRAVGRLARRGGRRRGPRRGRPRARVRRDLPRARPHAGRGRRARQRRPRDRRAARCCASIRTCAPAWRSATATCWSTTCRSRTSPTGCCCGCWRPSTATSSRPATTTRRSSASAPLRRRTCATSRKSCRTRPSCAWSTASAAHSVCSTPRTPSSRRWRTGSRSGSTRGSRRARPARSPSGAPRTSARRRRASPPTSSG